MPAQQPNIILITTDQQRYDTVGERAPDWLRTPHLDQLARRGITFRRAYSDTPICVPARCTIMSGKHAFNHGMMSNRRSSEVLGHVGTLPARMHELSYQTLGVGKMHFEPHRARHGFDECLIAADYHAEMLKNGHQAQPMRHGLGQCEQHPGMATVPEALTYTSWTAEQCVDFIRNRRDPTRPFFLWCSFSKPHPPLDPPEPYYSMYRGPEIPIPDPVIGDWARGENWPAAYARTMQRQNNDNLPPTILRAVRAAYYGLVTQIDYNIGRILAALYDTPGLMDETSILFTADHGEYLGDHRGFGKGFFHEASAHVPFIYAPARKHTETDWYGIASDQLVCLADLLPTFAGLGGGAAKDVDGHDILAIERGQRPGRDYLEGTAHDLRNEPNWFWAITDGHWKYIWYPEGEVEQLFDVDADPDETTNLANHPEHADQKERLRAEMVRRHEARGSTAVENGRMKSRPLVTEGDSERERRSRFWQGLHTEYLGHDVQH